MFVSTRRDAAAARAFFIRALRHGPASTEITTDGSVALSLAVGVELLPDTRQSRQGRAGDRHGDAGTGGNQGTSRGAAPARRRGQALAGASTGAADGLTAGSSAVSSRTGERTMVRGFGGGSCSAMLLRLAATDPPSYVASRLQPSA
jgi:hypothetical protein